MSFSVNEINDSEFGHIALVTDGDIEAAITLDYGPRIVSVKKEGGASLLFNSRDEIFDRCHGHKMRITLERSTNGIYCDDQPVRYSPMDGGVRFVQTIIDPAALEVTMDVVHSEEKDGIMIVHSVLNKSADEVKLSIYTETPFSDRGFVFVPQSNTPETEKPGRILTLWHGVKWSDSRLFLGDQYITVSPTSDAADRLKIGCNNTAGWCGYTDGESFFIKRYVHSRSALYPFYSCSTFATSCSGYMSLQTTSPFYRIAPGETARHVEHWLIPQQRSALTSHDEAGIDGYINEI